MSNKMNGKAKKPKQPEFSTQRTENLSTGNFDVDVEANNLLGSPFPTIDQLTLDEKLALLSGKTLWLLADLPRFQVPSITVADGPHGVRKPVQEMSLQESAPATCFPTAAGLACSWDTALIYQVGVALQQECLALNVSVLLGPGLNLKRHPAGGRNFEYLSEDPYLSGTLATAYVQGVQSNGQVGVSCKHFAVNNQESHRFVVNAVVDERSLRELYLRGFEMVVKEAQPWSLMCAYNKVNGVYCSENSLLNNDILRKEWGFEGIVMTDWGATNDRVRSIGAGMDLEMPGSHGAHNRGIKKALKDNRMSMEDIDICGQRMLDLLEKGQAALHAEVEVDLDVHHELAYQVAMQCAVLLKNQDGCLPLKKGANVAVIGDFGKEHPRYQGMGSSQVKSSKIVTVWDRLSEHTDTVHYAPGYHADDDHPTIINQVLLDQAVVAAMKADVVLLCVGLPEIMESEGFDRPRLSMPAQHNALVDAVCAVNKNVVVILSNGGAIELPWVNRPQAILEGYLLGQAGGQAIADLVFGVQSPCGKLAETFPVHVSDILANKYFPGTRDTVEYREGLDVGYRYFDTADRPVRFPFGHGLSYSKFEYSGLELQVLEDEETSKKVQVTLHIKNVGSMAAAEVVQCYIRDCEASVYRPKQELKSFSKVRLEVGESKEVCLILGMDAFSFYDVGVSDWVVEPGAFEIRIGSSSRDIRLHDTIDLQTGKPASHLAVTAYPPITDEKGNYLTLKDVNDATFARRFGTKANMLTNEPNEPDVGFHRNSLLKEIASSRFLGKILLLVVSREAAKEIKRGPSRKRQMKMIKANVENLPLRVLVLFSEGGLTFRMLDTLISTMNFKLLESIRGLPQSFVGMFKTQ
jgi:beta-glucosidase